MRAFIVAIAVLLSGSPSVAAAQTADTAAVLFQDGNFEDAAVVYEAYHAQHPDDLTSELNLGAIRLYENDLTAAEPLLRGVLTTDPKNERATRLLGELYRRRAEAERHTSVEGGAAIVPFVTANPLPVVRVVADGTTANFVVDTGADVSLDPHFAAAIGLTTSPAGVETLRSLAAGGAVADDVPAHVLSAPYAAFFPNLRIDGVIGTTYFERFLATIDYPNNRLILRPRSAEGSAAFEAAAAQSHTSAVPCYLVGDRYVMAVAQVNGASGLFLFDSGLPGGGLMPSQMLVDVAGIALEHGDARTSIGASGPVQAIPFVAEQIAVGTTVQRNVPGLFTPETSPLRLFTFTVWGAISNEFLRHYAFTVDFDAMKLLLSD